MNIFIGLALFTIAIGYHSIARIYSKTNPKRVLSTIAKKKLENLGFYAKISKQYKEIFLRPSTLISISSITSIYSLILLKYISFKALIGILPLLISLSVITLKSMNININVNKEIEVIRDFIFKVRIHAKLSGNIRNTKVLVCDLISDDIGVVDGTICSYIEDRETSFEYTALGTIDKVSRYVLVSIDNPLSFVPIPKIIETPIAITRRSTERIVQELLYVAKKDLVEPSIDRVRHYSYGDELRLLVPKSIAMIGGLRVKVLQLESTSITESRTRSIGVVLSDYVCRYVLGRYQLFQLIRDLGIDRLYINGYTMDISGFIDEFDKLCINIDSVHSDRGLDVLIVPPDRIEFIAQQNPNVFFVVLAPLIDIHIVSTLVDVEQYTGWIERLRDNVERYKSEQVILYELDIHS